MKRIYIIFLISLIPLMTFSQRHHGQGRMQKISHEEMRSEKVAYLTTQIDLSMDEAQKFWPIYNAYQKEFESLITEAHDIMFFFDENESNLSNTEVETKIDRLIQIDEEKAAVASKYHKLFKTVLSNQKIAKLYCAEQGFRRHLLEKYRQHGRGGNMPPPEMKE
ncbi:MAG: hypothetical protein PF448_01275 [Bacteroidales bacterium]|jgi:hypothetical protein|nr:hypothetical protein [Bacteroidales bacterium]